MKWCWKKVQYQMIQMKIKQNKTLIILVLALSFLYSKDIRACDSTSISKYENGNKKHVEKFKNGEKCGIWNYYAPTGYLERRERYRKGQLVFTWHYNEEGRLSESVNKSGKRKQHKSCGCH